MKCGTQRIDGRAKNTNRIAWWCALAPAVLIVMLFWTGCGQKESVPQSGEEVPEPYQEFGSSTLFLYSGMHKLWRLESDYMRKSLSDTAKMLVVPVRLILYDTVNTSRTRVFADSGHTTAAKDSFYIWGNVYVHRGDGLKIRSESLWWDQQRHKIGSSDFVEIITPQGDIMRGKGLDATETFSTWRFLSSVEGEFPNFRERAESDEL
ncbi:MAG: LPS export ABC transporter periplasmic protein LptC [Chitinivibrionales bacterium]|nr:LPS export ABC transporter periplasmic protein LptC [Chitinivibrionales bacterium]MBD3357496.1 LPS export ABC transporter periplasmic protein LptC [Chitinivibrionales bacterium]